MSEESAKDYLRRFVKDHPSYKMYAFDVIDHDDTQHGGHHPPQDSPSPDWCTCTYCREMPTEAERRCCGRASQNCYSRLPVCTKLIPEPDFLRIVHNVVDLYKPSFVWTTLYWCNVRDTIFI